MLVVVRDIKSKLTLKKSILFCALTILSLLGALSVNQYNFAPKIYLSSIFIFFISGFLEISFAAAASIIVTIILCLIQGMNFMLLLQLLEFLLVSILFNRWKKNLFLIDLLFWVLAGIPMTVLSGIITGMPIYSQIPFFILIMLIGRLLNALLADIVFTYLPAITYKHGSCRSIPRMSFNQILFHLSTACIIFALAAFTIFNNLNVKGKMDQNALDNLKNTCQYISDKLTQWTKDAKRDLKLRNPIQVGRAQELLNMKDVTSDSKMNIEVRDEDEKLITTQSGKKETDSGMEWKSSENLITAAPGFYKWYPETKRSFFSLDNGSNFLYIYEAPVENFRLVIKVPFSQYSYLMYNDYFNMLKILVPFSILIVIFSVMIKRIVIVSITKLIGITYDLPERLKAHEDILLPKSNILEMDSLITNFQGMSNNLNATLKDIKEANEKLQVSERMLYKQAHYDMLTDLPNRLYFTTYSTELFNRFNNSSTDNGEKGFAFLMIDLDGFKDVNDTLGHAAGDKLLQEFSRRMKDLEGSFKGSSFIARLGGDEFIFIVTYTDMNIVYKAAALISTSINEPILIDEIPVQIHGSIGISLYPENGNTLESLLKSSDYSMYAAKQSGGNSYHFYSDKDDPNTMIRR